MKIMTRSNSAHYRSFDRRIFSVNFKGVAICVLSYLVVACTTTTNHDFEVAQYQAAENQIDLSVELNITKDFREYVWQQKIDWVIASDKANVPFNDVLADNAIAIVQTVFSNVHVNEAGQSISTNTTHNAMHAVLTPRVSRIRRIPPLGSTNPAWNKIEQIVEIEWTLESPTDGVIWQATSVGKFQNRSGTMFSAKGKERKRIQKAIEQAYTNAKKIMLSSHEIREYSDKH